MREPLCVEPPVFSFGDLSSRSRREAFEPVIWAGPPSVTVLGLHAIRQRREVVGHFYKSATFHFFGSKPLQYTQVCCAVLSRSLLKNQTWSKHAHSGTEPQQFSLEDRARAAAIDGVARLIAAANVPLSQPRAAQCFAQWVWHRDRGTSLPALSEEARFLSRLDVVLSLVSGWRIIR